MTPDKELIKSKREDAHSIEFEIEQIVDKYMDEGEGQWFAIDTLWGCDKSPFGWCAYHIIDDRAHDHCIYCHEPQERK